MSDAKPEQPERRSRSGPSSGSFKVVRVEVQELSALAGTEPARTPGADLLGDELLIDRVLLGERVHYELVMRRHAARLYRIARGICRDVARADVVVQTTFVKAYENLGSYDRRLRFGDWLSRIALDVALAQPDREPMMLPAGAVRRSTLDLVHQLEDAVDALPRNFRIAFTLCVLDGMPPTEVAPPLGCSSEAVQLAVFRGRLRVRRELGMRFDDAEARAFGLDLSHASEIIAEVHARLGFAARPPFQR